MVSRTIQNHVTLLLFFTFQLPDGSRLPPWRFFHDCCTFREGCQFLRLMSHSRGCVPRMYKRGGGGHRYGARIQRRSKPFNKEDSYPHPLQKVLLLCIRELRQSRGINALIPLHLLLTARGVSETGRIRQR